MMPKLSQICVYCGSNHGRRTIYTEQAKALGRQLVDQGIDLVYGGGHVGLMGVIADAVLAAGGQVTGVIPRDLAEKEVEHDGLTALHVVESMHQRKAMMAKLSDGFIAMPGGLGTLEELFETWTWAQLGYHPKPIGLLNVDEYFSPLIRFLDQSVNEHFVLPIHRSILMVETEPGKLIDQMTAYEPPTTVKWIDEESA